MFDNNTNLTQEMLQDILTFFVTVAQKKILTRADGRKPEITNSSFAPYKSVESRMK